MTAAAAAAAGRGARRTPAARRERKGQNRAIVVVVVAAAAAVACRGRWWRSWRYPKERDEGAGLVCLRRPVDCAVAGDIGRGTSRILIP